MRNAFDERLQGFRVLQVPDVVRDERVVLFCQAERVLQLRAAGEHWAGEAPEGGTEGGPAHGDWFRDVAAGAAEQHRGAAEGRGTGSAVLVGVGRVGGEEASAIPLSRSSASPSWYAIGSSETLPLVRTSGRPAAASSRGCSGVYGSMTPSGRLPGATDGATAASGKRGSSTIGLAWLVSRAADASSVRQSRRAAARSAVMIAKGLSSRCLRARSAATARSLVASVARW